MFTGGYRENAISSLDAPFPKDHNASTEEYEYFSDSGLDEEDIDIKMAEEVDGEVLDDASEVSDFFFAFVVSDGSK